MATASHSRVCRTIPLLMLICLLGRAAVAQGAVFTACDPNQWVPLAPPSAHWVFSEPPSVQTKLVTVELSMLDADSKPISGANIRAYCEPWDFTPGGSSDASGRWRVVGPIGDWSFFATKSGSTVICSERIAISTDTNVTLTAIDSVQIEFVNQKASPFITVSPGTWEGAWRCLFTPTSLPSPVGTWEMGLQNGKVSWRTTPQVSGIVTLMGCPGENTPGYVVFQDFSAQTPSTVIVDEGKLGCLRFRLDGLATCETWWNLFFEPVDNEVGKHHIWVSRVPSTGRTCEVRVAPGLYRISPQVWRAADWTYPASWVPATIHVEPNSVQELRYGGVFEARLDVMLWNPGSSQIWVDIVDNLGQYLTAMSGTASLRLTRGAQVLFDGPVERSWGQYIDFANPLADEMRQGEPVQYEYEFSSPVLGSIKTTGVLPRYEDAPHELPSVAQSARFELHSAHDAPYAGELLGLLECSYDWLVQKYSGPFSPLTRERFNLVDAYGPGGGWSSSDDRFGTDLYYGYCQTGGIWPRGLILHEFAHACMWSFLPQWSGRTFTGVTSEPLANLMATYMTRAIYGERAIRSYKQYFCNPFFESYAAGMPSDMGNAFALLYIDGRYGQEINRDFFLAMCTNQDNLGTILETAGFLKTEPEYGAALYSYLTNDNLAWLYRWAGFQVSDEIVDQGATYLRSCIPLDGHVATSDPGTANLAAHYRLDGNAQESSDNGNNGTIIGNPTWVSAGKVGGALQFHGSDYIECGDQPSLNLVNAVTMSAWIKLAGPTPAQYIAGNQDGIGGGYKIGVFSNKLELEIRTAENWAILNRDLPGGTVLTSEEWYHVAGTYSEGKCIATYVNGIPERVLRLSTSAVLGSTTGSFKIGCEPACRGYLWQGSIDDLRVYNKALSPAEVAYLADETPEDGKLGVSSLDSD